MVLTQEEIDALLAAGSAEGSAGSSDAHKERLISYAERIAEAARSVMGRMSNQEVVAKVENLGEVQRDHLADLLPGNAALIVVDYTEGLEGRCILAWDLEDAAAIAGSIGAAMGVPAEEGLGEMGQGILAEATSTLFGTAATTLAAQYGAAISTAPPTVVAGPLNSPGCQAVLNSLDPNILKLDLNYNIAENVCTLLISERLRRTITREGPAKAKPGPAAPRPSAPAGRSMAQSPKVQPVAFEEFNKPSSRASTGNLDLILGISLEVKVELGRTHMKVKDILELGSGSVIELDKLAGEPVELFVNDHLFAKGEVIVIDENFGIRITDIVNVERRIDALR